MGVLACDRAGCENIMCDRLSHIYGYICDECFDELSQMADADIEAFMWSRPSRKEWQCGAWRSYLNEVFGKRKL